MYPDIEKSNEVLAQFANDFDKRYSTKSNKSGCILTVGILLIVILLVVFAYLASHPICVTC
jgi:hypothetical protein